MRDYDIESDLKQEKFQSLKLVQGDRGNKIKINIYEDGQPVSLTGCSVTAKYKRADGEVVDGTVENKTDNYFYAVMNSNITKVAGTLKMLFSIEKDDVKVSTFLLFADVREGIGENTGSSGGDTEVTVDLEDYQKKMDNGLETKNKYIVGAINEVNSQCKDIAKQTITTEERTKLTNLKNYDDTTVKTNIQNVQQQVNNLVLQAGNPDSSSAEIEQARGGYTVLNDRLDSFCSSIDDIENNINVKFRLSFKLGTLSYGKPASNSKRIYTDVYYSTSEIELEFDYSKFRCTVTYYSNLDGETMLTETGWKSEKIVIEKGVYFRLLFSSGLDNLSEITMTDAYNNSIYKSIKMIDNKIYSSLGDVKKVREDIEMETNDKLNEVFTTITSKNLLDETKLSNVAIENGVTKSWTSYHTTDYIFIEKNKIYKFSENEGQNTGCQYINYYDADKKYLSSDSSKSIVTLNQNGYVRLSKFTNGSMENKRWQLEEVTEDNQSATYYVPYSVQKTVKEIPSKIKYDVTKNGRKLSDNAYNPNIKSFIRVTIHRGKTSVAPENTIPAYEEAVKDGYNSVETDVQFTSDGIPVLLHDNTIDRTSNGTGTLTSMTYEEVSQYDFGSWKNTEYTGTKIPTLDEFIFFCKKKGIHPYVELKNSGLTQNQAKIVINICKKYNMLNYVTFISFYKENLRLVLVEEPCLRVGILSDGQNADTDKIVAESINTGYNDIFINVDGSKLTNDYFNSINQSGYKIEAWTFADIPDDEKLKLLDGYTRDL